MNEREAAELLGPPGQPAPSGFAEPGYYFDPTRQSIQYFSGTQNARHAVEQHWIFLTGERAVDDDELMRRAREQGYEIDRSRLSILH